LVEAPWLPNPPRAVPQFLGFGLLPEFPAGVLQSGCGGVAAGGCWARAEIPSAATNVKVTLPDFLTPHIYHQFGANEGKFHKRVNGAGERAGSTRARREFYPPDLCAPRPDKSCQ
jgi:hypothetical protein